MRAELKTLSRLFSRAGSSVGDLALPLVLGSAVGLFEAAGVWLLVQLASGLLSMDYGFIRLLPAYRLLVGPVLGVGELGNRELFALLVLSTFMTFLAKNLAQYASSASVFAVMRRFGNGLRKLLFGRCLSLGKSFFDKANAGHLQAVILDYPERIVFRLTDLHQMLTNLFMLAAYVAMMFYISAKITLVILLASPLLLLSSGWLTKKIKRVSLECIEAQTELRKKVFNALACIALVKAYCMEPEEDSSFSAASDEVERLEVSTDKNILLAVPIQEIAALTLILALVLVIALIVAKKGPGRLPGFFVYFYVLRRAATTLSALTHFRATLASLEGPVRETAEFLDGHGHCFVAGGSVHFPGLKREIELSGLDFAYSGGAPVLKDVNCRIRRGEMTALVGPSGSGKSTLINLLMRFYDCPPATIWFDGTDIREFSIASLRESVAMVSQEALLFNDTLKSNILYGLRRGVSDQELEAVVRQARLSDLLARLPAGFQTRIGDRGVQLSGGERQRISIARAMLKGADILIFDEATSALDSATEGLIQAAISEAIKGRTAVVIAHRLSTVKMADTILVLDGGRVVEAGAFHALLASQGRFAGLWAAQGFVA